MNLAGGQRKRVNIGVELVANPTLLFLDEPTRSPIASLSAFLPPTRATHPWHHDTLNVPLLPHASPSGLDSTAGMHIIGLLRGIARRLGLTICAVVHQPRYEAFALFDDLILLHSSLPENDLPRHSRGSPVGAARLGTTAFSSTSICSSQTVTSFFASLTSYPVSSLLHPHGVPRARLLLVRCITRRIGAAIVRSYSAY